MSNFYQQKKHLFFDLDHTIWDFDKNSEYTFKQVLQPYNFPFTLQDFIEVYLPINQKYWKIYQENKITHEDLRFHRLNDVFLKLNHKVHQSIIHQISEDYILHLPNSNHLLEGALEILSYLKHKYILHIITNGFAFVQNKKLENAQIKHYFTTVTNSEMAGVKKPHQNIFNFALSLAKASKEESLMIGDSLDADIFGALNFGIDAIYFNPENNRVNPEVVQINHLLELKKML